MKTADKHIDISSDTKFPDLEFSIRVKVRGYGKTYKEADADALKKLKPLMRKLGLKQK